MKILCIGRVAYDITMPLDLYPKENTKVKCYKKFECGGGSASNCAYLLGKWGTEVAFAGNVGNDDYGRRIIDEFTETHVDTTNLKVIKKDTPVGYILINMVKGTRTIITYSSNYEDVAYTEDMTGDIIITDGYYKETVKKVFEANKKAIKVIDAGKLDEDNYELASLCDYVVCSKNFAEDVTKIKIDLKKPKVLSKLYRSLKANFKGEIIVTLEDKGCLYYDNGVKVVATLKMTPVDTTGAGDIFHGAFLYALSKDYPLIDALKLANITGALSVRKIGGRGSVPELQEVLTIFNNNMEQKQ